MIGIDEYFIPSFFGIALWLLQWNIVFVCSSSTCSSSSSVQDIVIDEFALVDAPGVEQQDRTLKVFDRFVTFLVVPIVGPKDVGRTRNPVQQIATKLQQPSFDGRYHDHFAAFVLPLVVHVIVFLKEISSLGHVPHHRRSLNLGSYL